MWLLGIVSIIYVVYQIIKEALERPIPAENWANMELFQKDISDGVPMKQCVKNAEKGRYYLPPENHPEPHRSESGKIIIENELLWKQDLRKHGDIQAYRWAKQGRYNLTPEELEKERERISKIDKHHCR